MYTLRRKCDTKGLILHFENNAFYSNPTATTSYIKDLRKLFLMGKSEKVAVAYLTNYFFSQNLNPVLGNSNAVTVGNYFLQVSEN